MASDWLEVPISIHAAQEGCDDRKERIAEYRSISIHAAQEGCDAGKRAMMNSMLIFQSTQPKRAATV